MTTESHSAATADAGRASSSSSSSSSAPPASRPAAPRDPRARALQVELQAVISQLVAAERSLSLEQRHSVAAPYCNILIGGASASSSPWSVGSSSRTASTSASGSGHGRASPRRAKRGGGSPLPPPFAPDYDFVDFDYDRDEFMEVEIPTLAQPQRVGDGTRSLRPFRRRSVHGDSGPGAGAGCASMGTTVQRLAASELHRGRRVVRALRELRDRHFSKGLADLPIGTRKEDMSI